MVPSISLFMDVDAFLGLRRVDGDIPISGRSK